LIKLAEGVKLEMFGKKYDAVLWLSAYCGAPHRPAITVNACREGTGVYKPFATLTVNVPGSLPEDDVYLTVVKNYSENEGLLEQLIGAVGEDGKPLFELTEDFVRTGFVTCPVIRMINRAAASYDKFMEAR
jgi:hypothetical protein